MEDSQSSKLRLFKVGLDQAGKYHLEVNGESSDLANLTVFLPEQDDLPEFGIRELGLGYLTSVAITPDGRLVCIGSGDGKGWL